MYRPTAYNVPVVVVENIRSYSIFQPRRVPRNYKWGVKALLYNEKRRHKALNWLKNDLM